MTIMKLNIDEKFLLDTAVKLVQTDTRNPLLCKDSPGDTQGIKYLAELYDQLGIEYKIHNLDSKQANIVAGIKGKGKGKTLLLNAHLDTVGTDGMKNPFSARIDGDKLFGRGSQDMKGSLAAMIAAAKYIIDNNIELDGSLLIAAVADEEYTSVGTLDLLQNYCVDAAIVTEPTNFSLVTAHRGFIWYEVETTGKAAHGSRYDIGIDANLHMGKFLAELDSHIKELNNQKPDHLVGKPSMHASVIKGGTDISTYSGKCILQIERRTIPGEKETDITAKMQSIIDKLSSENSQFQATVKPFFQRPQFKVSHNAEIVKIAEEILKEHFNSPCVFAGAPFWTDAALMSESGVDTIILGPVGDGLHTENEWVSIKSLKDLTKLLVKISCSFCNK